MSEDAKVTALEAEIVATRLELAATVDELTTRLDPRRQAAEAVDGGKRLVRDAVGTDPAADPGARTKARVVLGAGAVAVAAVVGGLIRRRR